MCCSFAVNAEWWLFFLSPVEFNVLKERMSRVCIVVLEEVEDDSPVFISKLPQESKSLHSPFSGNVLPSLVQAIFNGDPDEVRALIFKKEDVNFQ
ncbi:hypothetical protein U0070_013991, partial [Myodes glareolus]